MAYKTARAGSWFLPHGGVGHGLVVKNDAKPSHCGSKQAQEQECLQEEDGRDRQPPDIKKGKRQKPVGVRTRQIDQTGAT